ncbi:glycosyltransferase [Promicromonospora sp. NPDC019610]|uniref:glycosyltransferase n=1 Tax=Promicromonospora sp. NPDC019610 TaxID=3364405 RepID=UPI003792E670
MTRIIVAATSIYGHVAPMLTVAKDLIARGHDVTFVTGSAYREVVEATGATFAPVAGAADIDMGVEVNRPERLALAPGIEQFAYDMRALFIDAIPEQFRVLDRLLAEAGEPVVLVHEVWFWGGVPFSLGAATPHAPSATIAVGITQLTVSSIDLAPYGAGLPPERTELGRARNRKLHQHQLAGPLGQTQRHYDDTLRTLGVFGEVPYFLDTVAHHSDRLLQLSLEELSYVRPDLPKTVEFVGALPSPPANVDLPAWWNEVVQADQVVVVTQGTFANHDLTELLEPAMQALADLPVLVVAATGCDVTLTDIPENARVAQYIPFAQLLPETDLLITNGGFGGVQQSLSYGVPMALAGVAEEKLESNVRVAATGAAIDLATQRPTPAAIRAAALEVLGNKDYRVAAGRLQTQYAELDPLAAVAATVDELSGAAATDPFPGPGGFNR